MPFKRPTFNIHDLQNPVGIERVLLQLTSSIESAVHTSVDPPTDAERARTLAPFMRAQLQATGNYPLNLQDLLPETLGVASILQDTHAVRVADFNPAEYAVGTLFYETDRTVLYYINDSNLWAYLTGIMRTVLASLPGDLGTSDAFFMFEATDYSHVLEWQGSAWTWGPGETGNGTEVSSFVRAPADAGVNAWQVCDGTTVAVLNQDGTTSNITTPDYQTAAYVKLIDTGNTLGPTAASGVTTSTVVTAHTVKEIDTIAGGTGDWLFGDFVDAAHVTHNHGLNNLELRNTELLAYMRR